MTKEEYRKELLEIPFSKEQLIEMLVQDFTIIQNLQEELKEMQDRINDAAAERSFYD